MARSETLNHQLIGVEYLRVSVDRSGREKSQGEQHAENVAEFGDQIAMWAEPYNDTGSASEFKRRDRDDFERLVDDLRGDRFAGDVLVLWEPSRGSRDMGEWCTLIDLCRNRGVRIAVTNDGRFYDPANGSDVHSLHMKAADAQYESAKVSKRVRRSLKAEAANGRPHGRIKFGYRREYQIVGGTTKMSEQLVEPAEAVLVVELFERVAQGHSLKSIANDWKARGVTSRQGVPFSSQSLRQLVLSPTYAGLREHRPKGGQVTTTAGTWPAIVSLDLYDKVHHRLTDPRRRTSRPGRGVHLLSMIGACDVCGGRLKALYRRDDKVREYACHDFGHVRLNADELDRHVERIMLTFLGDPAHYEKMLGVDDSEVLAAIRDEIALIHIEIDSLADEVGRGELSPALAARAEPQMRARLADAEKRLSAMTTPNQLRDLITPGPDVVERWIAAPMSTRREVARYLVGAGGTLGHLRVRHAPPNQTKVPVGERVVGVVPL